MLSDIDGRSLSTVLPADAAPLSDHRVHGAGVLPGVFLIDLVLRTLDRCGADPTRHELARCLFRAPVVASGEDIRIRVALSCPGPDEGRVLVSSSVGRHDDWTTNLECEVRVAGPWPSVPATSADPVQGSAGPSDLAQVYAFARHLGIEHGPFMRPTGQVDTRSGRTAALLRLGEEAAAAAEDFWVHPVLLDSATLVPFWSLDEELRSTMSAPLIPLYIDRVLVRRGLPAGARVVVPRVHLSANDLETLESDILLAGEAEDDWSVGLFGFTAKRVRDSDHITHVRSRPAHVVPDSVDVVGGDETGRALVRRLVDRRRGSGAGPLPTDRGFYELGLDSGDLLTITEELEDVLGCQLYPTLLFDHPTPAALTAHLQAEHGDALAALRAPGAEPAAEPVDVVEPLEPSPGAVPATAGVAPAAPGDREPETQDVEPIAIVGLSARFPGAPTVDDFWEVLRTGSDCVSQIPPDRWDWRDYAGLEPGAAGRSSCSWGGFLEGPEFFDPLFFAISPRDAAMMDPQERLFLETSWAALEDAGFSPGRVQEELAGEVGVFAGAMWSDYQLFGLEQSLQGNPQVAGSWFSSVPNRVSFALDLHGPSVAVDSACSSSLQAVHLACQSIRSGECRAAIAGGVNLSLHPSKYVKLSELRMLSPSGRCHAFGDRADGYVPGEGVGAVVLRPLRDAIAAGDQIHAVIRGSAVQHGGRTGGFSVPSAVSQAALIRAAHRAAGVDSGSIDSVEAHGTGTSLGDPIEVRGLTEAFGPEGSPGRCALGSVKSNIGHLEAAAGIAALTKVVLSLRHRTHVPTLHADPVNSRLDLAATPFRLVSTAEPWVTPAGRARRAGISSFGAGGNNVHLVVEEYLDPVLGSVLDPLPDAPDRRPFALPLSARSDERLTVLASSLREHLALHDRVDLADVAYTLQRGREPMETRCVLIAQTVQEVVDLLTDVHDTPARELRGVVRAGHDDPVAMIETAEAWAAGHPVDWSQAWSDDGRSRAPRTVALPTYPFLRRRCWIDEVDPGAAVPTASTRSVLRPTEADDGPPEVALTVAADTPWLVDHVLHGRSLVPGTMLMEILGGAAATLGLTPDEHTVLSRVELMAPVTPAASGAPLPLRVRRRDVDGRTRLELLHEAEGSTPLAWCTLGSGEPRPDPRRDVEPEPDPADGRAVSGAQLYDQLQGRGWSYGPALRLVTDAVATRDRVTARLASPSAAPAALLLDAALQTTVLALPDDGAPLPWAFDDVRLTGRRCTDATAVVRRLAPAEGAHRFALSVVAPDGEVIASAGAVALRGAASSPVHLYVPRWTPQPMMPSALGRPGSGTVVLVEDDPGRIRRFRDLLGERMVVVSEGPVARRVAADAFVVRPGSVDDVRAVLDALADGGRELRGVVCTAGVGRSPDLGRTIELTGAICSALTTRFRGAADPLPLVVAVAPGPTAALAALARTVRLEQPGVRMRTVRFDDAPPDDVAGLMLDELADAVGSDDSEVRHAGREARSVRAYAPLDLPDSAPSGVPVVRAGASYLITGGAGGIGAIIAQWLAGQRDPAETIGLVLVGRSAPDEVRSARLDALRAQDGVRLRYVQGDVTDAAQMRAAVRVAAELGPLRGVVHAAGVLADGLLATRASASLGSVWSTKAVGAQVLDRVTADCELDYLLCCGSAASSLGSVGQAEYALANRFLTEFSEAREAQRERGERRGVTCTVDWPLWRDGGMTVPEGRVRKVLASAGLRLLDTHEALRLLPGLLSGTESSVVVLPGDAATLERRLGRVLRPGAGSDTSPLSSGSVASADVPGPPGAVHPSGDGSQDALVVELTGIFASLLKVTEQELDSDVELAQFGIDSVVVMAALDLIETRFEVAVPPSTVQAHLTLKAVAEELAGLGVRVGSQPFCASVSPRSEPGLEEDGLSAASEGTEPARARTEVAEAGVAVIAAACRVGGAGSAAEFWDALIAGRDLLTDLPAGHWPGTPDDGRAPVRGAFLRRTSPGGAPDRASTDDDAPDLRDPQQDLLRSTVADLLDAAGYPAAEISGSRTGVFVGATGNDHVRRRVREGAPMAPDLLTGALTSMSASRISKWLDLRGPSQLVDTACSSSLVAVHTACQSILAGECDAAVAGGVTMLLDSFTHELLGAAGLLSASGRTRVFDRSADGYTLGEGAGLVLLKSAARAYADGDQVLAVIRGSAVNHDGRSLGLTAPNADAQTALVEQALDSAGGGADRIGHLEISGSASSFGDPLEVHATGTVLTRGGAGPGSCAVSCVKSTIGALLHAGGVLALIKSVLSLHHRYLPASIAIDEPHPRFAWERTPFRLLTRGEAWRAPDEGLRRGAVSSFGVGGTNAHVIVEEADPDHRPVRGRVLPRAVPPRSAVATDDVLTRVLDGLDRGDLSVDEAGRVLVEGR